MTANLKALVREMRDALVKMCDIADFMPDDVAELIKRAGEIERMESEPRAQEWRPIETAPKDGTHILVAYKNHYGKWRRIIAFWSASVLAQEDSDEEFAPPGWYEYHDSYEDYEHHTENEPMLWQPLPEFVE